MEKYFNAEKKMALILMVIGVISMCTAIYFIFYICLPKFSGLALPFSLFGAIEILVGSSIFFRTDKQLSDLSDLFDRDKISLKTEELKRLAKVNQRFKIYQKWELALLCGGLILAVFGAFGWVGLFLKGAGAGIALHAGILAAIDVLAEQRAFHYSRWLKK